MSSDDEIIKREESDEEVEASNYEASHTANTWEVQTTSRMNDMKLSNEHNDGNDSDREYENDIDLLDVIGFSNFLSNKKAEHSVRKIKRESQYNIEEYSRNWPGRESFIRMLIELFGQPGEPVKPVFITGDHSTGKTGVVKSLLEFLNPPYAFIECINHQSARSIFETIINQLCNFHLTRETRYRNYMRCDDAATFIKLLASPLIVSTDQEGDNSQETIFLVFDQAEKLTTINHTILPILLRIDELVPNRNICVILISRLRWYHFQDPFSALKEPITILFPQYSKDQIIAICAKDAPSSDEATLFQNFVGRVYDVVYSITTDLNDIRHVVNVLFSIYKRPITMNLVSPDNEMALFKHILPYLKKGILHKIYMRELTSDDLASLDVSTLKKSDHAAMTLKLPRLTKFLLLAAYLASHVDPKLDQRVFSHVHTKSNAKVTQAKKISQTGANARIFSYDRMMAIFESITDQKLEFHTEIYTQTQTLVTLKFLLQISPSGTLDNPKFKCTVSGELIESLARNLHIDLGRYMIEQ